MRELHGVSLPGVAFLRRAAAGLVVGSLLVLCFGQPFHPGAAFGARDGFAVTAPDPAVDGASLPHGGAHLPGLCSICRVIAQTRLALRSPAIATPGGVDTAGLLLPLAALDLAPRAPWLVSIEPRAPPSALPVQNS